MKLRKIEEAFIIGTFVLAGMVWGYALAGWLDKPDLVTVAENTGLCGSCGNATRVIIKEAR